MPSLLIPDLDPVLTARLAARAAAHGRAPAEEARLLLAEGLAAAPPPVTSGAALLALAQTLFGADHGVELDLPPRNPAQDRPVPDFA